MADWNATQYLKFERERTRPAIDLLSAVMIDDAQYVVDLGCGPGNSTQLLVDRYPHADVMGLDTSPDMLAKARKSVPRATFVEANVAGWVPTELPDLIFANAVLQWVPDHARLFPKLLSCLRPGGVLAVQMPDNLDEPPHQAMRAVATETPFAEKLAAAAGARTTLASFEQFDAWLRPGASDVDLWRTTYVHRLNGAPAIVEWVKATGLRPFIDPLDEPSRSDFLARYEAKLDEAYPQQADGKSLLRFPRLFIVATKA